MFRELCDESALRNVALVTNVRGNVSQSHQIGEARVNELSSHFFKPTLDQGARGTDGSASRHRRIRSLYHSEDYGERPGRVANPTGASE